MQHTYLNKGAKFGWYANYPHPTGAIKLQAGFTTVATGDVTDKAGSAVSETVPRSTVLPGELMVLGSGGSFQKVVNKTIMDTQKVGNVYVCQDGNSDQGYTAFSEDASLGSLVNSNTMLAGSAFGIGSGFAFYLAPERLEGTVNIGDRCKVVPKLISGTVTTCIEAVARPTIAATSIISAGVLATLADSALAAGDVGDAAAIATAINTAANVAYDALKAIDDTIATAVNDEQAYHDAPLVCIAVQADGTKVFQIR